MSHETGAVLAAGGYANASGRLGVATVTHGPGLTNTVTALVDAVRSRTPLLLIAGDTDQRDSRNLQNIDQYSIVQPTGAIFEHARSPETVMQDVGAAVARALNERMPVVLNIPVNFQWEEVDIESFNAPRPIQHKVRPDQEALAAAVAAIATAKRPMVLAGHGARKARGELLKLAERLDAPVATTLRGKGLFVGHPLDLGIFGGLSHERASAAIAQSDCIIVFGSSLHPWTTKRGSLLEGKTVVHIDADPTAIDFAERSTHPLVSDTRAAATEILQLLDEADLPPAGFASSLELDVDGVVPDAGNGVAAGSVPGTFLVDALRRLDKGFPRDRTLVVDDGRFLLSTLMEIGVPGPEAYIHTLSFASIGLAIASAVGAKAAVPDRPMLVVCGDGGFMSAGLNEFSSAVRHGLDMVVVIINDGAYGAEHMQFRARGLDPEISTFNWPDFAPVADALGGMGLTVRSLEDLDIALEAAARRDRPVLIDLKIHPDDVPAPGI